LWSKATVRFDRVVGRQSYRIHRWLYRRTGGLIGHRTAAGTMLLLTSVGRRSGQLRTNPLLYMADGERYLVVGSNGGRPQPPAWLLNVAANPRVRVQVGRRTAVAEALILSDEDRAAVWPRMIEYYSGWDYYGQLTERTLRVVSITPVA
jgi:deazaflavin-dependent oxidoreductase (nitroreductase family)